MERVKARGWRRGIGKVIVLSIIFMEKRMGLGGMLDA